MSSSEGEILWGCGAWAPVGWVCAAVGGAWCIVGGAWCIVGAPTPGIKYSDTVGFEGGGAIFGSGWGLIVAVGGGLWWWGWVCCWGGGALELGGGWCIWCGVAWAVEFEPEGGGGIRWGSWAALAANLLASLKPAWIWDLSSLLVVEVELPSLRDLPPAPPWFRLA